MTKLNTRLVLLLLLFMVGAVALGSRLATMSPAEHTLIAAGDIADCTSEGDEATAALLDTLRGTVVTLGDNAYPAGETEDFANCYDKTWGRHKERTLPSPGNHDYYDSVPYYAYFGRRAGDPDKGYYSLNLGDWHIISLNSNIDVQAGSEQEKWLRADLASNKKLCTLAFWHHPLFSSGDHGNDPTMRDLWRALYEFKADVVLNGHSHSYERFAPQDPDANADPENGITSFVVGTGGGVLRDFSEPEGQLNSEVKNRDAWGVLKLTLEPTGYRWEFVPVPGAEFTDAGSALCVR